jgi:phosphinothricin acetyltransferase
MPFVIRLATTADAEQVRAIYGPVVRDTAISFEVEPPTVEEMGRRIQTTLERFPWLVCESNGQVQGYAYAGPHRARAAYQWSLEVTVYVHADHRRLGVGRAVYSSLFKLLALQGFYNAYAGITLPNPPSVGLHESIGFQPFATYREVGYKMGAWHDVGWWEIALQERETPSRPLTLSEAQALPGWNAALATGPSLLTPGASQSG